MTREEYNALYEKYLSGNCTSEEREAIENYQDSIDLDSHHWIKEQMGEEELVKEAIHFELLNSIARQKRRQIIRIWYAAAAVILLVLSSGLYFNNLKTKTTVVAKTESTRFKNDVLPGDNRAILTLDDGSQINLDDAQNGVLASENNTDIRKTGSGQLEYSAGNKLIETVKYNTLSTPMGGQYQLSLPDGSRVWLNSGSSIRFPTAFIGKERIIELKGEAFFDIRENKKMPFIVKTNMSMDIRVLGTQFNVMAYDDEKSINTTLLEGSVQLLKESGTAFLEPGQAAILNKGTGKIKVAPADIEEAVAWKNGYFIFSNENIESIMRKVSRWYNVEVDYQGNLSNKDFVGTISRDKNISEILKMLELTGAIHFRIEGRRITVMP
ncbi:MAG TPA: FecR domain-containing protein [Daejeonella sp.]|uniref:FecR family protein n=1 Tax=Daejeonella sp. TaxID=2805397 RepID=UPI002ED972F8